MVHGSIGLSGPPGLIFNPAARRGSGNGGTSAPPRTSADQVMGISEPQMPQHLLDTTSSLSSDVLNVRSMELPGDEPSGSAGGPAAAAAAAGMGADVRIACGMLGAGIEEHPVEDLMQVMQGMAGLRMASAPGTVTGDGGGGRDAGGGGAGSAGGPWTPHSSGSKNGSRSHEDMLR